MVRERDGCVVTSRRVRIAGGDQRGGASDWAATGGPDERRAVLASFDVDSVEVTVARWRRCVSQGACPPLDAPDDAEPGQPVRGIAPTVAERLCQHDGGRLPTSSEWTHVAAGSSARRFPWGDTGLVCRRAAFGLERGPCGTGARGPDLAGARPDGATPDGVMDLSGSVAEWTRETSGRWVARGGSYLSASATDLKVQSVASAAPDARHVGFRCVYPEGS